MSKSAQTLPSYFFIITKNVFIDTICIQNPVVVKYDGGYYVTEKKYIDEVNEEGGDFTDVISQFDVYYYVDKMLVWILTDKVEYIYKDGAKFRDYLDQPEFNLIPVINNYKGKLSKTEIYSIDPPSTLFFMGIFNIADLNSCTYIHWDLEKGYKSNDPAYFNPQCGGNKRNKFYNNLYMRAVTPYK